MTYQLLCAYDGSPSADKAFDFSLKLAVALGGRGARPRGCAATRADEGHRNRSLA